GPRCARRRRRPGRRPTGSASASGAPPLHPGRGPSGSTTGSPARAPPGTPTGPPPSHGISLHAAAPAGSFGPMRSTIPRAAALASALFLSGCGGGPPESLGGFELGLTQAEVLEEARSRGAFSCRLRATRPRLAECEGPTPDGVVTVVVRDDSVVRVVLRLEPPADERPGRAVRRFVEPFGDPIWRDRPVPPRASPPERYHTYWLDADSTRALAMVCV